MCSRVCLGMASCSSSNTETSVVDLQRKPHQPVNFNFPKRSFGKTKVVKRSFQGSWFKQWPFLHYDEAEDSVYCQTCSLAFMSKKVNTSRSDPAFVSK